VLVWRDPFRGDQNPVGKFAGRCENFRPLGRNRRVRKRIRARMLRPRVHIPRIVDGLVVADDMDRRRAGTRRRIESPAGERSARDGSADRIESADAAHMNCANNLLRDHDDITAILRVLRATVSRLEQGCHVDPDMLAGLDRFLREFVVECHFRKEETIVFPHLRAVLPDETDRTLACTARHDQCAASLQACHMVVERVHDGGMGTLAAELAAAAPPCLDLLAAHIAAERPLLERLRRRPPDAEDERLLDACAEVERHYLGPTGREWYAQLVADYADIVRTWM
jgi:hemerythrin-like domain-containing protein